MLKSSYLVDWSLAFMLTVLLGALLIGATAAFFLYKIASQRRSAGFMFLL